MHTAMFGNGLMIAGTKIILEHRRIPVRGGPEIVVFAFFGVVRGSAFPITCGPPSATLTA